MQETQQHQQQQPWKNNRKLRRRLRRHAVYLASTARKPSCFETAARITRKESTQTSDFMISVLSAEMALSTKSHARIIRIQIVSAIDCQRLSIWLVSNGAVPLKFNDATRVKIMKCSNSLWKLTCYDTVQACILTIAYHEPWSKRREYFRGWPNQELKLPLKLFYMCQCGFYLYSIFALFKWETRRKDFSVMMSHHVVTVFLIEYSYITGFFQIGSVILALPDASDVFLEAAKVFKYSGKELGASVCLINSDLLMEQGIYECPIYIQALFYFALRCALQMLKLERDDRELIEQIDKWIPALNFHIQNEYWLALTQLNDIYYITEEYSRTALNKFNVIPESIICVFDFMNQSGGYLIGNVSPAHMDFRWFLVGNCIPILSSLATPAQAKATMDLIEGRWEDLIGEMPLTIAYPALGDHQWKIFTRCDLKNTVCSYHSGGSWSVLLWLLTAASIKAGRPQIAKRETGLVEQCLSKDWWPEYWDGKTGLYIGKQARKCQIWSIAGYVVVKMMIENPSPLSCFLDQVKTHPRPFMPTIEPFKIK